MSIFNQFLNYFLSQKKYKYFIFSMIFFLYICFKIAFFNHSGMKPNYQDTEKLTVCMASELLHLSERSAQRYMARCKRALGIPNYAFLSVGRFKEFYNI